MDAISMLSGNGSPPATIPAESRLANLFRIIEASRGGVPCHAAASAHSTAIARVLLEGGADPNWQDSEGNAPLHIWPNAAVTWLLLKHGANPNLASKDGTTPLHCGFGTQLLLDAGAEVNARNDEGETPLFCQAGYPTHVRELLRAGSDTSHPQYSW